MRDEGPRANSTLALNDALPVTNLNELVTIILSIKSVLKTLT